MGQYLKLFNTHTNYQNFVNSGQMLTPNVSHCVAENEVHYNEVLPVNQELWAKFKQLYGSKVTNEDRRLFATYPMTYEIYNDEYYDDNVQVGYAHWMEIHTDVTPCFSYNNPNPDYRSLSDLNISGGNNLYITNQNETATFDDFIGLGSDNHIWFRATCGK